MIIGFLFFIFDWLFWFVSRIFTNQIHYDTYTPNTSILNVDIHVISNLFLNRLDICIKILNEFHKSRIYYYRRNRPEQEWLGFVRYWAKWVFRPRKKFPEFSPSLFIIISYEWLFVRRKTTQFVQASRLWTTAMSVGRTHVLRNEFETFPKLWRI